MLQIIRVNGCLSSLLFTVVLGLLLITSHYGPYVKETKLKHVVTKLVQQNTNGNTGRIIKLKEKDNIQYTLKGYTFNKQGRSTPINDRVDVGFLHSFYPDTEQEAVKSFVEPLSSSPSFRKVRDNQLKNATKENVISCLSPAMVWFEGTIHMACRIWLQSSVNKRKYMQSNHFLTNYVYLQTLDEYLQPVRDSRFLGIPLDVRHGPEDLRMFEFEQKLYLTFGALTSFQNTEKRIYWQFLFDLEEEQTIVPKIGDTVPLMGERNWSPMVVNGTLYLIRSLHPLVVLDCRTTGDCAYAYQRVLDGTRMGKLRGGTSFHPYRDGYYVGFAHSTVRTKALCPVGVTCRVYNTHLVVIHTGPLRIVYISQNLQLPKSIFEGRPIAFSSHTRIMHDFFFPFSALHEDPDTVVIGGHVNDHSSILIRLTGIANIMNAVIEADRADTSPKGNGPPFYAVDDFMYDSLMNETGLILDKSY